MMPNVKMRLYNTLTRRVEDFISHEKGKVKMYTCGPTVYHYAHIGNIRNYIGHDILEKTLRYIGYDVIRAMNITDVGHLTSDSDFGEDKMEVAKKRENKSALEIADFYTNVFFDDLSKVNCCRPEIVSKATDNIDQYIIIIEKLISDGYAYLSGGNVYFDTVKLDNYYALTNHKEEEMFVGVRDSVGVDDNKRNQADFVLWFTTSKYENHELLWDSPWGLGYPGWHIECSGISIKYLGEYLDIHCGGVDNIFPHHTNEIAQSEAYLGHQWCHYWFHNEHLLDEVGKMSKSKGDFLTVSLLEDKGYDPLAFRFMCLNSHYRKQLVFSYEAIEQSAITLKKIRQRISNLEDSGEIDVELYNIYNGRFSQSLADDLNTSNALSVLYEVIKDVDLSGKTKIKLIDQFDKVLSLDLFRKGKIAIDEKDILMKIEERNLAKKNKDFLRADAIRDELLSKGIRLIDTRNSGTTYEIV